MGRNKKAVSLQTIADELGISKYSVSLALNNKPGIGEDLRTQVFEVAGRLHYNLKPSCQKSKKILVIIPDYIRNDSSFYSAVYWSIEQEGSKYGYAVILTSVSREAEEQLQLPGVFENDCIGIITVGVLRESYMTMLLMLKLPIVSVDHYYEMLPIDAVITANEIGAYQAVSYLVSQGHTRIGFVGSVSLTASISERWFGFQKAMAANKLPIYDEYNITDLSPLESQQNDLQILETRLAAMKSLPSACFCASDMTAINYIKALDLNGLHVPNDVSIISYDGIEASNMITPNLTTYNVPRQRMGATAVLRLLEKTKGDDTVKTLVLRGNLTIGNSVKKLTK